MATEETRMKLSAALTGRTLSTETRAKISAKLRGRPLDPVRREKILALNAGRRNENHHFWKGDAAGYRALHYWIARRKTKTGKCSTCSHTGRTQWSNISGLYFRDVDDFVEMCAACNNELDSFSEEES